MKVRGSAILFVLALAAGCQSTSSSSGDAPAQNGDTKFSGFLGDYSQLKPEESARMADALLRSFRQALDELRGVGGQG
jgi:hypothetical protein